MPTTALRRELPRDFARWRPLERDQYVEAKTLMSGYLLAAQGDRMAMAASIEARFPFLDHRVIEFACRLPPRLKLRALREKVLLKRAFADQLPASIVARSKQPYRAPDSACFFAEGRPLPWVAELLSADALRRADLFDPLAVGKLLEKCRAGRAIGFGDNMAFVGVLSTMLLHEQFIAAARPWRWRTESHADSRRVRAHRAAAAAKVALVIGEQRVTYAELHSRRTPLPTRFATTASRRATACS